MNAQLHVVLTLAHNEVRLRLRRLSTLFALLAVVLISWTVIVDPSSGHTLIAVNDQRVLYTSSAMAMGSAAMCGMMVALGGFYLVRGRISEDIRSGVGSVIGATPVGNATFLAARWLGAVAYLAVLVLVLMCTTMICQLVRGDGPVRVWVYLQAFVLVIGPSIIWAASCALLFDSVAFLLGKGGDVLYFFVWMFQLIGVIQLTLHSSDVAPSMLLDFSGTIAAASILQVHLNTTHISIGGNEFNASLAPLVLADTLWTVKMTLLRVAAAGLALLPLLPAAWLFHRYSPDRIKVSRARVRRSPLTILNELLRPLSRLVRPLLVLSTYLPGMAGQLVADVALTLLATPSAVLALLILLPASVLAEQLALGGVLMAAVALWGILVSDVSTRDHTTGTAEMTSSVTGGAVRCYMRHYAASVAMGLLFMAPIALRFATVQPIRALAVVAGILGLSAFASMLGRTTNTSRTFLALFLFGFYVSVNAVKVPMLDAFGFNGVATLASSMTLLAAGAAALAAGFAWSRHQAR